jgi:hypothetical protein
VLHYLEHGTFLDDLSQREVARVRRRARSFCFENQKLYKRKDKKHPDRRVPGLTARLAIVKQIHNISHAGIDRLRTLVSTQFYWPDIGGMAKNVRETCPDCQRLSNDAIIPKELKPIPVSGVLQRWHIDLIGPFPTSVQSLPYLSARKQVRHRGCR